MLQRYQTVLQNGLVDRLSTSLYIRDKKQMHASLILRESVQSQTKGLSASRFINCVFFGVAKTV